MELNHLRSQTANQRNYPLDITEGYPTARSHISGEHDFKPLQVWTAHSSPLHACELQESCDWLHHAHYPSWQPTTPHYPPCIRNRRQYSARLLGVQVTVYELRSSFWYLDLAAGGSDKSMFRLHFQVVWVDTYVGVCADNHGTSWKQERSLLIKRKSVNLQRLKLNSTRMEKLLHATLV